MSFFYKFYSNTYKYSSKFSASIAIFLRIESKMLNMFKILFKFYDRKFEIYQGKYYYNLILLFFKKNLNYEIYRF